MVKGQNEVMRGSMFKSQCGPKKVFFLQPIKKEFGLRMHRSRILGYKVV